MRNYKLILCYDGSRYNGWQKQGNTPDTIQGKVETLLSRLLEQPIDIAGSGRTDEGAHARRQVASFRADTPLACAQILDGLRRYLPEDIGALSLEEAAPRFHARLSCKGKTYVYRLWTEEAPNVFERKYVFPLLVPLDLERMRAGAKWLCGTHDYASFCANKNIKKSTVRTIQSIDIERAGGEVRFTYTGDGFLYKMVRILTGTLVEVGQGMRRPEQMVTVLASEDREKAGPALPAQGLILWEVYY